MTSEEETAPPKKWMTLVINADDAVVPDESTCQLVLVARSATVFLPPNRRAARTVASVKLRRDMPNRLQRWDGHPC